MGHAIIKVMSFSVDVWNTIENRGVNSDMETQHIIHNFEPIYNEHSKILMFVAKRIRRREKARSHLH